MVTRRRKKVRKQRGSRTYGRGCAKRGRGSGERGGTGMSGGHKQKWSYVIRYMPDYFGKHGFTRPPELRRETKAINVGEIEERLEEFMKEGAASQEGDRIVVDVTKLGYDKVLGGGRVSRPIVAKSKNFADLAVKKLKEAGGDAIAG
ncbi:MAG: uL15 family ribosomal protein [Candidatus Hadarchaeales archaeon]